MKNIFLLIATLTILAGCQSPQAEAENAAKITSVPDSATLNKTTAYGQAITAVDAAKPAEQVPTMLQNKDSIYLTLKGTALTSCTKKGCWMTVDIGKGDQMRVTFKDYGFFVPKDLNGEQVVLEGSLQRKVSSVEEQRHYAEDAGKSAREVEAIQQADTTYAFEAVGVLIYH